MVNRRSGLLMWALLVACTPSEVPPVAPPRAAPALAPDASSVAPPDAAPSPPAPPAEPVKLTPPPGVDAEAFQLLTSICAASYVRDESTGQVRVGCRSHPPFTAAEQKPDGTLTLHQGDINRLCSVDRVYHGSFTKAGANQAVLSFETCDDGKGGWGNAVPGSAVLLEESGGRWREIGYEGDVNAEVCLVARGGGRDVLLCKSNLSAVQLGTIQYFFAIDFATTGKHARTLARIYADDFACGVPVAEGSLDYPSGFTKIEVGEPSLADVDKDGVSDWVIPVTRARATPSKGLDARIKAACKAPNPSAKGLLPAGKKTELHLLRKGDRFVATPATKKTLELWFAESSEGPQGLNGVAPPGAED